VARNWEQTFRIWTKPSSDTEAEKQENAARMIGDAIGEYAPLKSHNIRIIPQGSYRNNTNVRHESDVDICVCCMDYFFSDFTFADYGKTEAQVVDATYTYAQFKNDVQKALETKFGKAGVHRGDKAFDVHQNTYRVDADVVCTFAHHRYQKRTFNPIFGIYLTSFIEPAGTEFYSDSGKQIINWPEQHYVNGVAKNKRTGLRFKSVVRAMKNLKFEMEGGNIGVAKPIASYLTECLLYNLSDALFIGDSYTDMVRNSIVGCYDATATAEACSSWCEVNELKYLFHPIQPWRREQVQEFLLAAWKYCEFI
jgi:hypothetical protein